MISFRFFSCSQETCISLSEIVLVCLPLQLVIKDGLEVNWNWFIPVTHCHPPHQPLHQEHTEKKMVLQSQRSSDILVEYGKDSCMSIVLFQVLFLIFNFYSYFYFVVVVHIVCLVVYSFIWCVPFLHMTCSMAWIMFDRFANFKTPAPLQATTWAFK